LSTKNQGVGILDGEREAWKRETGTKEEGQQSPLQQHQKGRPLAEKKVRGKTPLEPEENFGGGMWREGRTQGR